MPDYRDTEGERNDRKPASLEAGAARHHVNTLIVELLRAIAKGSDDENRVGRTLVEFSKAAAQSDLAIDKLTIGPIIEAHKQINFGDDGYQKELGDIVINSLRVAAEAHADDNFSESRKSKAESVLINSIKTWMRGETRSRSKAGRKRIPQKKGMFRQAELKALKKAIKNRNMKAIRELTSKIDSPQIKD